MEEEHPVKTPLKYFQMESAPAGLTNYKKNALFSPPKESGVSMQPEGMNLMSKFDAEAEMREEPAAHSTIQYIRFEDLEAVPADVDRGHLLVRITEGLNSKNWKDNSATVDLLRSINKTFPADMNEICTTFWPKLSETLQSLRSALAKNALMFITEVILLSKGRKLPDHIVLELVSMLSLKCFYDKGFVKAEAQRALDALVSTCVYDSTLVGFCRECFNKNAQVSELSTKVIARLIGLLGINLPQLQPNTFRELFVTLAKVMEGKRQAMETNASEIIRYLYNVVGCDNFLGFIKLMVDEQHLDQKLATNLTKPFNQQTEKRDRSQFKELVKQQKQKLKESGGQPQDKENDWVAGQGSQPGLLEVAPNELLNKQSLF